MRVFNDRNIATKIAIGFACILAIMAVISTTAYFAFEKVDGGFRAFARQSTNSNRAATVDQNFLFVRWQAREYGLSGEQSFLDGARKGLMTLTESIQAAETAITNPERKQRMAEVAKQAATWKQASEKMVAYRQEQAKLVKEVIDPVGSKLRADFQEIQATSAKTGNSNAAVLAGEGAVVAMQVRLNVEKVLARHDNAAAEAATKAIANLKQVLTGLDGATKGSEARKYYDELKVLTDKYVEGYAKASHDAHEIESLLNGDMRKFGEQIAATAGDLKTVILKLAADEEHAAESLIASVEFLIMVMAIGGLVTGRCSPG